MSLPKIQWPIFEIEVPSLAKKVKFRQILVREEKILLMAKESGEIRDILLAVKQIVNNCCIDTGVDIEKLAIFDLEWVFMQLTAVSATNVIQVSYQDGQDDEVRTFDIALDKITPPSLEGVNNNIQVTLEYGIIFDFPAAGLYQDDYFMNKETKVDDLVDYLTIKCIKKIYGPTEVYTFTEEELKDFIGHLDIKSMEKIRAFFRSIPSMSYVIEYENSKKNKRKIVLSTLNDFFSWL
jgi:hypothetical protein